VEIVSVGGGFGDAIGVAALGDDVAARVIAPGFPAGGVAHGSASADGIGEQPLMVVLFASEPWSFTATKFTRLNEPTPSSNQPIPNATF